MKIINNGECEKMDEFIYCKYCQTNHGARDFHASFVYNKVYDGFIVLKDKGKKEQKSLTNDIEYAMRVLQTKEPELTSYFIVYKDSLGNYDEILLHENGDFRAFRSLGYDVKSVKIAMRKCLEIHRKEDK